MARGALVQGVQRLTGLEVLVLPRRIRSDQLACYFRETARSDQLACSFRSWRTLRSAGVLLFVSFLALRSAWRMNDKTYAPISWRAHFAYVFDCFSRPMALLEQRCCPGRNGLGITTIVSRKVSSPGHAHPCGEYQVFRWPGRF